MRKLLFSLGLCFALSNAFAQPTSSGNILNFSSGTRALIRANAQGTQERLTLSVGDGEPSTGSYIELVAMDQGNPYNGTIGLVNVGEMNSEEAINFTNFDPYADRWTRLASFRRDGKVVIGQDAWSQNRFLNTDFKLYVQNGILTERVKVSLLNAWPDYVFHPGYKLMPLGKLQQFIQKNQHLPEIPAAGSLEANGLDLGEMQTMQMQKIEELTLYIIELNKKVALLEKKLAKTSRKKR